MPGIYAIIKTKKKTYTPKEDESYIIFTTKTELETQKRIEADKKELVLLAKQKRRILQRLKKDGWEEEIEEREEDIIEAPIPPVFSFYPLAYDIPMTPYIIVGKATIDDNRYHLVRERGVYFPPEKQVSTCQHLC